MERFLDTENAALISMHYPQAQREVHFGTAPFNRGEDDEEKDDGQLDGEESGEESANTGAGTAGAQSDDGRVPEGGYAGENQRLRVVAEGGVFLRNTSESGQGVARR